MISAIIFDFDGVIADTERLHLRAFQEVFTPRGWPLDEAAYFDRYLGYDDHGLVAAYARERRIDLDDDARRRLVEAKVSAFGRHLASGDILYPGAKARFAELRPHFAFGIASGALHHEIETILREAGVLHLFPIIVGADDVRATKPSPEPYVTAAARLGVAPSSCLAVEDSPPGIEAARAAGMRVVAVTTSLPRHALADAHLVIDGLDELTLDLVASMESRGAL